MEKGICNVSVAPLRAEPAHQSEMVSQILYGESVDVLEINGSFSKIRMHFDQYEGWVDTKQISEINATDLAIRNTIIITETFRFYDLEVGKTLLSVGSEIFSDDENVIVPASRERISETVYMFLNVPYLWSGRSFFGIDCSGLTQLVYKINGISLPRDAHQQAENGRVLDFIEESQPGDLAFFENTDGKISHVGIMLEDQKIIHAFGKVRIDTLDSSGIFNQELNKHTHKLRFVKSVL
ncbi:C40 family peptidase [Kaistella faecalis]|uniref:C40 family peptidase n=1 Tax=Kaistella faecalis TaxID=2852098 RepID=UPI001C44D6F5|nr:C40 family peptidase [Chryseobacterium faecale]UFK98807.1 C40 family peptidase [Chryseobacterium faecale]